MAIDTTQVAQRRSLYYEDLEELLADAERMFRGPSQTVGNWTLAQIFDHLARSLNAAVDGMIASFPAPTRFVLRFLKKRILSSPMKPGFRCPNRIDVALRPADGLDADQSLLRLRDAVLRFQNSPELAAHPAFGKLTRSEWSRITLRHAELHMSFAKLA